MSDEQRWLNQAVYVVSDLVNRLTGIQLGEKQASMVESRLRSRMLKLNITSFSDYLHFLYSNRESESQALLSLLTTHHSYFFREFTQFEFLRNQALPQLLKQGVGQIGRPLKIWSAACSRGQEAYSLAIFLDDLSRSAYPNLTYEILATDVDEESVQLAKNGVYARKDLKEVPLLYLNRYFVQGRDEISDFLKIRDFIKDRCTFETYNLLDILKTARHDQFDIIFCRNLFIYFLPEKIKVCGERLLQQLAPHGFLCIGISETLSGFGLAAVNVGPSIYQPLPVGSKKQPLSSFSLVKKESPIRVICVDDSSVVLTMLQEIFSEKTGFVVAATARSGKEAAEILKRESFDVMTLDLHMPEMDGLTYLKQNFSAQHPPVILVTSVAREEENLLHKALGLGASDHVRKPAVRDLQKYGDELRAKIKTILHSQQNEDVITYDILSKKEA